MASEEKPPSWTPVDQHVGQVPIALSQDIDTAGVSPQSGQDAKTLASEIVRRNQPVINRFVAMQRQHIEIGDKNVHNAVLPLQSMDVYYQHVQGMERMHYHITPQAEGPSAPPAPPEEVKAPEPPKVAVPEPEIPEPGELPEFKEPELPEEEVPEEKKEHGEPEFLEIDIPCFLAVEFGDGAA